RRRRADRPRLPRRGPPGTRPDDLGAHGQRPARAGRPATRRHRDGVRVRGRGRPDQAHLGSTQPRQAPALDHGLTRPPPHAARAPPPPAPRPAAAAPPAPPTPAPPHHRPQRKSGASPQPGPRQTHTTQTHNGVTRTPPATRLGTNVTRAESAFGGPWLEGR